MLYNGCHTFGAHSERSKIASNDFVSTIESGTGNGKNRYFSVIINDAVIRCIVKLESYLENLAVEFQKINSGQIGQINSVKSGPLGIVGAQVEFFFCARFGIRIGKENIILLRITKQFLVHLFFDGAVVVKEQNICFTKESFNQVDIHSVIRSVPYACNMWMFVDLIPIRIQNTRK